MISARPRFSEGTASCDRSKPAKRPANAQPGRGQQPRTQSLLRQRPFHRRMCRASLAARIRAASLHGLVVSSRDFGFVVPGRAWHPRAIDDHADRRRSVRARAGCSQAPERALSALALVNVRHRAQQRADLIPPASASPRGSPGTRRRPQPASRSCWPSVSGLPALLVDRGERINRTAVALEEGRSLRRPWRQSGDSS